MAKDKKRARAPGTGGPRPPAREVGKWLDLTRSATSPAVGGAVRPLRFHLRNLPAARLRRCAEGARDVPRRSQGEGSPTLLPEPAVGVPLPYAGSHGLGLLVPRRRLAAGGPPPGGRQSGAAGGRPDGRQRRLRRPPLLPGGPSGRDQSAGGAEVVLDEDPPLHQRAGRRGPLGLLPEPRPAPARKGSLRPPRKAPGSPLLVESRAGYKNLCRLLTAAARGRPKGEARASWDLLAEHVRGSALPDRRRRGPDRPCSVRRRDRPGPADSGAADVGIDGERVHVEPNATGCGRRSTATAPWSTSPGRLRLPLVATNGVRYARREDKPLHDVLTSIRHHTTLDAAGRLLAAQREQHLKSAVEMARLFADLPEAVAASGELPAGSTSPWPTSATASPSTRCRPARPPSSFLRHLTWNARLGPLPAVHRPRRRRRSRKSWTSSKSSTSPATS